MPYLETRLNERVLAWGLVGFGAEDLSLERSNETLRIGLGMRMGAIGGKGRLLDGSGASGIGLDLKSDAMWVSTKSDRRKGMEESEGDVSRHRLILQGERPFATERGTLHPERGAGAQGRWRRRGDRGRGRTRGRAPEPDDDAARPPTYLFNVHGAGYRMARSDESQVPTTLGGNPGAQRRGGPRPRVLETAHKAAEPPPPNKTAYVLTRTLLSSHDGGGFGSKAAEHEGKMPADIVDGVRTRGVSRGRPG